MPSRSATGWFNRRTKLDRSNDHTNLSTLNSFQPSTTPTLQPTYPSTFTPFQKATYPSMFFAAGFADG